MQRSVEFYYDLVCPFAYLASTQIERLAAGAGAALHFRPFLLGGVFRALGAPDRPAESMAPARARLAELDARRWAELYQVPLRYPEGHPRRTVLPLRAVLAAGEAELPRATHALYRAYWVGGEDISQPEVVRGALDRAGLDGAALLARADTPEAKEALRVATDGALRAGVFGAPTFVVHAGAGAPQLFWGQDRMLFVEQALGGWRAGAPAALPEGARP